MKPTTNFSDLIELMAILRRECPWDREQTHESIKDNLVEETYEVLEAIEHGDMDELKKELGDVLLHVVFHSKMAAETDNFSIDGVIYTLQEKLIHRHPHVFDDAEADEPKAVAQNWEALKMKEGRDSILEGIPPHLPALIKAYRMQQKTANVGFDWDRSATGKEQLWAKVEEELAEFKEVYEGHHTDRAAEEFGDLLFSIVNAGRLMGLPAEDALRGTNQKFERRFRYIEQQLAAQNKRLGEASLETLDKLWNQAKTHETPPNG